MKLHSVFTQIVLVSSLAFAGCAAEVGHNGNDAEEVDENGNALSKTDGHLVGAWAPSSGESWDFAHLVLKADGTYFAETQIECFTTPCVDPREEGTWRSTDFTSKTTGYVTLRPTGHASRKYAVSLASDGSGMKLSRSGVIVRFDGALNWCNETTDCAGQKFHGLGLMCMVGMSYHTVCDAPSHSCFTKCMSDK